jgi:hypothetical protein
MIRGVPWRFQRRAKRHVQERNLRATISEVQSMEQKPMLSQSTRSYQFWRESSVYSACLN